MTEDNFDTIVELIMTGQPIPDDLMFRKLEPAEEEEFRVWARENQTAEHWKNRNILHPVVRNEWERIGFQGA